MLASYVLMSEYMGSFTALVITPDYASPPITSLDQFWNTKMMWLGGRMTNHYTNYFQNVSDIEDRLAMIKVKENSTEVTTALEIMIKDPDRYGSFFKKRDILKKKISRINFCPAIIDT